MDAVMNWLWQGGVVAVAASVMLLTLRRMTAATRYCVCWAATLLILALPFLPRVPSAKPAADAFLPPQADAMVSLPDTWWTSALVIGGLWLAWASIQLARFIVAVVAIRRARLRSHAFPAHLQEVLPSWRRVSLQGRRARLVLSNSVTTAAVFGWGSPLVAVAPSLVRTLHPDDLDRVLIHEWAHVQRRDDIANVVQVFVRIIAGWHPALWWMDRRLHVEREMACDEMAVALTGSPTLYAECLMKLTVSPRTPMAMLTAPAVFASGLRARIVKIVSPRPLIAPLRSRGLAAAVVLVLCVVSVVVAERALVNAATFVEPLATAEIATSPIPSDSRAPEARPVPDVTVARPPRRAPAPSPLYQRTRTEPLPTAPPATPSAEPSTPHLSDESKSADAPRVGSEEPAAPASVVPEVASVSEAPPPPADANASSTRSPWSAAGAGMAIGRTSKDAGIATAGFFTRFAKRVAGSF